MRPSEPSGPFALPTHRGRKHDPKSLLSTERGAACSKSQALHAGRGTGFSPASTGVHGQQEMEGSRRWSGAAGLSHPKAGPQPAPEQVAGDGNRSLCTAEGCGGPLKGPHSSVLGAAEESYGAAEPALPRAGLAWGHSSTCQVLQPSTGSHQTGPLLPALPGHNTQTGTWLGPAEPAQHRPQPAGSSLSAKTT